MVKAKECLKHAGRPLGILSVGGYPGNYRLNVGLTGTILATGSKEDIIEAFNIILSNEKKN